MQDPTGQREVAVVGGGAAGFFAAIACARSAPAARVTIYEAGRRPLEKVRISGGGRCNVTHACFDPARLVEYYPRGARALRGPFTKFQPRDTLGWFAGQGVELKTEADGRVFPVSDDSGTIVHCLREAARSAGVRLITQRPVVRVARETDGLRLGFRDESSYLVQRLLLATGGAPAGMRIARDLGHGLVDPVPSLFTFTVPDDRLRDLSGVSVAAARVSLPAFKLRQTGPLLVTHSGLSGPAVLRLSAHGARELAGAGYRATLKIDWLPEHTEADVRRAFAELKTRRGARQASTTMGDLPLPRRLWRSLLQAAGIAPEERWSQLSGAALHRLTQEIKSGEFRVQGKSVFKEEFVTCGGVPLKEVDFRTMQSRLVEGLYFAGEILDVDALTGGFNFQNAWTTGYIAGKAMGL